MAAGLIGIHSERVISMTGTPYNNNCQDIATLMTFIDPSHESAILSFWKNATGGGANSQQVQKNLSETRWTDRYIIRREKKVIQHKLKKKEIRKVEIIEKESVMKM